MYEYQSVVVEGKGEKGGGGGMEMIPLTQATYVFVRRKRKPSPLINLPTLHSDQAHFILTTDLVFVMVPT